MMRDEGQVRQKLKQVLYRHLQKRLRDVFRRRPHTCFHNRTYRVQGEVEIGVCTFQIEGKPRLVVCDPRVLQGIEQAKACPWWTALRGKETVKAAFRDILETTDRGRIAAEFPDVAALLWVLDDVEIKAAMAEAEKEVDALPDAALSWEDKS